VRLRCTHQSTDWLIGNGLHLYSAFLTSGRSKCFTTLPNIHPFMQTASSSGTVRVRCLAQGHLDARLGRDGFEPETFLVVWGVISPHECAEHMCQLAVGFGLCGAFMRNFLAKFLATRGEAKVTLGLASGPLQAWGVCCLRGGGQSVCRDGPLCSIKGYCTILCMQVALAICLCKHCIVEL
jgi:hypothetical protein